MTALHCLESTTLEFNQIADLELSVIEERVISSKWWDGMENFGEANTLFFVFFMSMWLIWSFSSLSLFQRFFFWRFLRFIFSKPKILIQDRQSWNKRRSASIQCLPHSKPREERNATNAPCVPHRSPELFIWNDTFLFIPEKSRSAVTSVNTNAQQMVTSKHTCWHIQERSLSLASSVSSPAQHLVTSNNTCY